MTVREIYDAILIELNKENSQSFTTEEFNYVVNKAILAVVNEKYNFFGVNQQLSDDLRVLTKYQDFSVNDTTEVEPLAATVATFNPTTSYVLAYDNDTSFTVTVSTTRDLADGNIISFEGSEDDYVITDITNNVITIDVNGGGPALPTSLVIGSNVLVETAPVTFLDDSITNDRTLDVDFKSSDYMHILSCTATWKTKRPVTNEITHIKFPAKRMTQDMHAAIQNNSYLSPAPNRPYFQLFNIAGNAGGVKFPASLNDYKALQNKPKVKIYLGNKTSVMELRRIVVEYIKLPAAVGLLDSDIYTVNVDTSDIIELPDYLKNEVVKKCAIYLLEKTDDPRSQTHPAFNGEIQSIPMNMQMGSSSRRPQATQQDQQQ